MTEQWRGPTRACRAVSVERYPFIAHHAHAQVFDVAAVRAALQGRLHSLESELHQVRPMESVCAQRYQTLLDVRMPISRYSEAGGTAKNVQTHQLS